MALLGGTSAINLEGEVGVARNGSDDFAYALWTDFYVNRAFSVGLRYSGIDSDNQFGAGLKWFFVERVSGEFEFTHDDDNDDDIFQVRLAARF